MYEVKFKDKSILAEYDLNVELFDRYNFKVKDIYPVRNVFLMKTDSGDKILKKIDYSLDELNFIHEAIKYIKNSFNRVLDFHEANTGDIFVKLESQAYCVIDVIDGRECEFSNPIDISIASRALGEFHNASKGCTFNMCSKDNCGKIINSFKRRLEEIDFFKSIVNKFEHKNEFDEIFLENVDYYFQEIQNCISIMEASQYYKLCSEEDKIVLCHHDLAHHNILIKNQEAYFIDFDYSIIDIKVHDLCNFINKAIKNSAYDSTKSELIINEYCKCNTLDNRELEVLYGLLTFPQDFYDISRNYYTRRKGWAEEVFVYKLKKKISYKEDNTEFLEEFKKKFL